MLSAEEGTRTEERERITLVARSPCQGKYPADVHPWACTPPLETAGPPLARDVHLDAPGQCCRPGPTSLNADHRRHNQSVC